MNEMIEKQSVSLEGKTVLVTGSPGFIGANLVMRLLRGGECAKVISLDNMNAYYDPKLKEHRLSLIEEAARRSKTEHIFIKGDIADSSVTLGAVEGYRPEIIVHLAAQAGVRYSIEHPEVYISSNIIGFFNMLEAARAYPPQHFVYASSSSVYGGNKKVPFSTEDKVDSPVSLYAATKKSDELLAHCYSKLYDIPTTGLRFFTVYGPAGRPDMFYFSAAEKLTSGGSIKIFNYGDCKRDFTYIDDIIEGVYRVMLGAPKREKGADGLPVPPCAVYNIGGGTPVNLMDYIAALCDALKAYSILPADFDITEHSELVPMQPGDVPVTYADSAALERDYGFTPRIGVKEGLMRFAEWYARYRAAK